MSGLKLEVGKLYQTRDGRKVGPMRNDKGLRSHPWDGFGSGQFYKEDGRADDGESYDLIAPWQDTPTSPVRTVTRKEIVTGTFGKVEIQDVSDRIGIVIGDYFDATELRAAIAILTEIADALETPTP